MQLILENSNETIAMKYKVIKSLILEKKDRVTKTFTRIRTKRKTIHDFELSVGNRVKWENSIDEDAVYVIDRLSTDDNNNTTAYIKYIGGNFSATFPTPITKLKRWN